MVTFSPLTGSPSALELVVYALLEPSEDTCWLVSLELPSWLVVVEVVVEEPSCYVIVVDSVCEYDPSSFVVVAMVSVVVEPSWFWVVVYVSVVIEPSSFMVVCEDVFAL